MRKRFAFVAAMTVETVCRDPHSPSVVPRRQGPITTGSSFALRPPTQQPGLVPGIHVLARRAKSVDGRDKPGHDDSVQARYTDLRTMSAPGIPHALPVERRRILAQLGRIRAARKQTLARRPPRGVAAPLTTLHSPIVVPAQAGTHNHRE